MFKRILSNESEKQKVKGYRISSNSYIKDYLCANDVLATGRRFIALFFSIKLGFYESNKYILDKSYIYKLIYNI